MADGTPRIVMDLQCTLADVAALGLMPGVAFGIARITGEASCRPAETRIDTTSTPVSESKTVELSTITKTRAGELCIMACTFCADPRFFDWVDDRFMPAGEFMVRTEAEAKQFILETCDIGSRKELDSSAPAASLFHNEIRKPFMAWRAAQ